MKLHSITMAAVFVSVVGCTIIPGRNSSTSAPESIELDVLFNSVAAIRHASPGVLRKAAAEANSDNASELLHWSIVLIVFGQPYDKKRAVELLETYLAHSDQAPGSVLLASLLLKQLQDELRLQRRVAKAINQRADLSEQFDGRKGELRACIQELEGREQQLEGCEEELKGLRQQLVELKKQVEGLKSIELEMDDRALPPDLELPQLEPTR